MLILSIALLRQEEDGERVVSCNGQPAACVCCPHGHHHHHHHHHHAYDHDHRHCHTTHHHQSHHHAYDSYPNSFSFHQAVAGDLAQMSAISPSPPLLTSSLTSSPSGNRVSPGTKLSPPGTRVSPPQAPRLDWRPPFTPSPYQTSPAIQVCCGNNAVLNCVP